MRQMLRENPRGSAVWLAITLTAFFAGVLVSNQVPPRPVQVVTTTSTIYAAPLTTLAAVAQRYVITLPGTFRVLGAQIRAGKIKDKAEAVSEARQHAKPLADALDAAFVARCDAEGRITQPEQLAAELEHAARAIGGR